jgi:hypothetical protein
VRKAREKGDAIIDHADANFLRRSAQQQLRQVVDPSTIRSKVPGVGSGSKIRPSPYASFRDT